MRHHKSLLMLIVLSLGWLSLPAQESAPAQQEPQSLGEIARRLNKQAGSTEHAQPTAAAHPVKAASSSPVSEKEYELQIMRLLSQRNFTELDRLASEARTTKERLPGGVWKLFLFYESFTEPASLAALPDANREAELALLHEWSVALPASITAPVALASGYLAYADDARGEGFADTVTDEGWRLLEERVAQAKTILTNATQLHGRCPHWYDVMQQVALLQGWDKDDARALFDEAVAFEPEYYHYYREYANFLLPKWNGEDGDAEQFIHDVVSHIGGDQGAFLYFEVASVINCQCGHDEVHMANLSWPRIKQGYAALQKLYGSNNLKENRFAYMAFLAKDKPAAQEVLARIGNAWNPKAWRDVQSFLNARAWALADCRPPMACAEVVSR